VAASFTNAVKIERNYLSIATAAAAATAAEAAAAAAAAAVGLWTLWRYAPPRRRISRQAGVTCFAKAAARHWGHLSVHHTKSKTASSDGFTDLLTTSNGPGGFQIRTQDDFLFAGDVVSSKQHRHITKAFCVH
jgi:ABC-type nickel/cobalt efflux system permease component RcnA